MSDQTLLQNLQLFWAYLQISSVAQLYIASMIVLVVGLAYEVWSRSVRLSFLEDVSLQIVEKEHPYVPSMKIISVVFLCCATLLVVALQSITGLTPFDHPDEWMVLAGFFLICLAFGVVAETHWKGASDDAFAFIIGTALAFVFLVFRSTLSVTRDYVMLVFLLLCLLLSIGLAWTMLLRHWTMQLRIITVIVFALWIVFLSFR